MYQPAILFTPVHRALVRVKEGYIMRSIYPSDITREQFEIIRPILPRAGHIRLHTTSMTSFAQYYIY